MEEALIDAQDPAALVYDADTGKTDAYTGVSVDVSEFVSLASEGLASAGVQGSGDESGGRVENAATDVLCIVGGGANNTYLNHLTERAIGRSVLTGSPEATALGNILLQEAAYV